MNITVNFDSLEEMKAFAVALMEEGAAEVIKTANQTAPTTPADPVPFQPTAADTANISGTSTAATAGTADTASTATTNVTSTSTASTTSSSGHKHSAVYPGRPGAGSRAFTGCRTGTGSDGIIAEI